MLRSTKICLRHMSKPGVQRSCCKLLLEDRGNPDGSLHAWEVNGQSQHWLPTGAVSRNLRYMPQGLLPLLLPPP